MHISLISAVNNQETLERCLLSSPDIRQFHEVILQRGFDGAAAAYNTAIKNSTGEVLVFLHQDVYLPAGWFQQMTEALNQLALTDPHWGVLGVYGMNSVGEYKGHMYCNSNQCVIGQSIQEPVEVDTLDEVVLIIRKDSGLNFDRGMKGFHFYGTDICLSARHQGRTSYVIPGFCIHNTSGYEMFPLSFWSGYFYMRQKWKSSLPVKTPCIKITRSLWAVWCATVWRFYWLKAKRIKIARRVDDPAKLYAQVVTHWSK